MVNLVPGLDDYRITKKLKGNEGVLIVMKLYWAHHHLVHLKKLDSRHGILYKQHILPFC
jgi:hypothetical protein